MYNFKSLIKICCKIKTHRKKIAQNKDKKFKSGHTHTHTHTHIFTQTYYIFKTLSIPMVVWEDQFLVLSICIHIAYCQHPRSLPWIPSRLSSPLSLEVTLILSLMLITSLWPFIFKVINEMPAHGKINNMEIYQVTM